MVESSSFRGLHIIYPEAIGLTATLIVRPSIRDGYYEVIGASYYSKESLSEAGWARDMFCVLRWA